MLFKATYQANKFDVPTRETTLSLYLEAENEIEARKTLDKYTPYNIEFIQAIEGKHLEYEQNQPNFEVTEFPQ